jgi:osmotically-inducible protein OsmY
MAGNWMDDRERRIRERDGRGLSDYRDDYRSRYDEDRSWDGDDRSDIYGARGAGRERVFGERESGASYGGPEAGRSRGGSSLGGSAAQGWQSPDYEGVSPAMRQGAYGGAHGQRMRFSNQDYTRGGRYYGDDSREAVHREEYGQGGYDDTDAPAGYDAHRSATRERYHAQGYGQPGYGGYPGEYRRPMTRPAAGGYDYERGYGGGAQRTSRGERFEEAGRSAGDFLHRAGEKVASWFNAGGEGRLYDTDDQDPNPGAHGKRGLGPQGYKRSDERISDDAHERLTDDTWLDASNIAISVSACEVTLSGTVESREAKHRAERLVENISGVVHVQNNLRVARGNFLTSPTPGYGDSVLGAQMRAGEDDAAQQPPSGKKN